MPDTLRQRLHEMYEAYARCDLDAVLKTMDDDIDYVSYAPIDVFPFLGHHHGKVDLRAAMEAAHREFEYVKYTPKVIVTERQEAAAMVVARLRQRSTDRIILLFIADFYRVRDGRIVEIRQFFDSFDAVQQVLGQELTLDELSIKS